MIKQPVFPRSYHLHEWSVSRRPIALLTHSISYLSPNQRDYSSNSSNSLVLSVLSLPRKCSHQQQKKDDPSWRGAVDGERISLCDPSPSNLCSIALLPFIAKLWEEFSAFTVPNSASFILSGLTLIVLLLLYSTETCFIWKL